ncbi:putative UDP-glucuronosyl/UDP-glucosyltransferase [Medicago truncatula]|uniref:Glycosyltransferase n=1 Tax=Medicago truncatula TaxID=3880 RepID=A0A072TE41_MEDTR|nr:UDP-glucose flavonoid 3-O-glucosyltransferase 7 [Medicago truncatula]KEH15804.1 UDP-glucosyltransferase family protein [Medicago truncatula]RHN64168.1 putative UDP-glucuronosyl/UDP-glucosyltransferase [Medicago truncatula]
MNLFAKAEDSVSSTTMDKPLKLYFIPYLAAGHMIPLCDIASLFASRGHFVKIITTPSNAQILPKSNNFNVHTFQFPSQEVGLPDGIENLSSVTDLDSSNRIFQATTLLREHIENFVEQEPPDCIVADFLFPWVDELANKLHIPRFAFNGFSLFTICAMESLKSQPLPEDASGSFVIPNFPYDIIINSKPPAESKSFIDPLLTIALKSHGFIINSFVELDGEECVEYYERTIGHKAWLLGPASLVRKTTQEKANRGEKSTLSVQKFLTWLNSKRDNSVLYICFGTFCYFPDKQLYEIASALEELNCEFIWVVPEKKGKENESEAEKEKWLPKGFEERTKGMIVRGWSPQVVILGHSAIGAFLTHCGWNSITEAVSAGIPMITWPVHSDQFYNETLITQVHGIGVEVGADEWLTIAFRDMEKLIGRDRIKKALRRLMDSGDEAIQIRRRAQEIAKIAKHVVQEGGSSHDNLTALIDELKQLRDNKGLN